MVSVSQISNGRVGMLPGITNLTGAAAPCINRRISVALGMSSGSVHFQPTVILFWLFFPVAYYVITY